MTGGKAGALAPFLFIAHASLAAWLPQQTPRIASNGAVRSRAPVVAATASDGPDGLEGPGGLRAALEAVLRSTDEEQQIADVADSAGVIDDLPLWTSRWTALPGFTQTIRINEPRYVHMFNALLARGGPAHFGQLKLPKDVEFIDAKYMLRPAEMAPKVGVLMEALAADALPDGSIAVVARAIGRFRLVAPTATLPFVRANVALLPDEEELSEASGMQQPVDIPRHWRAEAAAAAAPSPAAAEKTALDRLFEEGSALEGFTQPSAAADQRYKVVYLPRALFSRERPFLLALEQSLWSELVLCLRMSRKLHATQLQNARAGAPHLHPNHHQPALAAAPADDDRPVPIPEPLLLLLPPTPQYGWPKAMPAAPAATEWLQRWGYPPVRRAQRLSYLMAAMLPELDRQKLLRETSVRARLKMGIFYLCETRMRLRARVALEASVGGHGVDGFSP